MNNFCLKQFAVLAIVALPVLKATAATWYVDASRPDDTGDGTSWGTAKKLLESGVALANTNGGSVRVADGTYSPAAEVTVTGAVTVGSVNGAGVTFVNGGGAHRAFVLNHTNCVVDGFTITNGYASEGGGAYVQKGILQNCRLIGNTASSGLYAGGGAYVVGPGIIKTCLISNNTASASQGWGGGLYLGQGGQALNCTNSNNRAYIGAGAFLYNGAVISGGVVRANITNGIALGYQANKPSSIIADCRISANTGPTSGSRSGGGLYIYSQSSTTIVTRCTIDNNWAMSGGGAYINSPYVIFDNCSIVSNTAKTGGGLCISGGYVTNVSFSNNCLIADNLMTTNDFPSGGTPQGGGVAVDSVSGRVEFDHCIISNNVSVETWNGAAGIAAGLGGPIHLRHCRIISNRAVNYTGCGGLNLGVAGSYVSNCVISGNSSSAGGTAGGILLAAGSMYNCLVSANSSAGYSGIYVVNQAGTTVDCCTVVGNSPRAVYVPGTQACIRNSIIVSNGTRIADNFTFQYNGATGSIMGVTYCCSPTNSMTANGNMTNDPAFRDYSGGEFRLSNRSPCINAGHNETWMTGSMDLDGYPRIRQGIVDMGAYEWMAHGTVMIGR